MRKYKLYAIGMLMCSSMLFSACGNHRIDDKEQDVQSTYIDVSLNNGDDALNKSTSDNGSSNEQDIEQTTEKNTIVAGENSKKVIDGFYNCTSSKQPCTRIDFEIKTSDKSYMAVLYTQYTKADMYMEGQILYGDKTSDNTYKFVATDEEYIVTWDGGDNLTVDGTFVNGKFERGQRDGYGEDDYAEMDILTYEPDKNVEDGIEIDLTLADAVRNELGYGKDEKLTYEDLESVTYIAAWEQVISSVKGISLLKNLEEIHIGSSYVSDISEMAKLEKIKFIDVTNCYIKEIPDFSECKNLSSLYLGGNMIKDVSPLTKIHSLKSVDLNNNFITSIEPLKTITYLEMLCIDMNHILDYRSIKDSVQLIKAYNYGAQGSYEQALQVENKVKEIVASFPKDLSELELEKVIYKYVKDHMVFDDSVKPPSVFGYCGIMNGWGVCGDYAEVFALIANHAGLESYVCGSDTHAWNIVKVEGIYYHCDALWDEDVTDWTHFNKSTGYISNLPDHAHDLLRYPICEMSMSVLEYCDSFGVQ